MKNYLHTTFLFFLLVNASANSQQFKQAGTCQPYISEQQGRAEAFLYSVTCDYSNTISGATGPFLPLNVNAISTCPDTASTIAYNTTKMKLTKLEPDYILMHPNPVTHIVTIEGVAFKEVGVYNMKGELLKTLEGNENTKMEIDLNEFPKGLYTIRAGNWSQKVIKE